LFPEVDCGTLDGLYVSALIEGGEVIERMGDRILGRVTLEDVIDPATSDTIVRANAEIDEEMVREDRADRHRPASGSVRS
jgi:DNA-directed RNA polymerase subunit beta'